MFKGLFNIVVKEVKELVRDPKILLGMIIVPLIMFPLMGFAIQTSMEAAEESMGSISMAIMDLDKGLVSENLTNFLTDRNIRIIKINQLNFSEAVEYVQQSNITVLMVVPSGFSNDTMEGVKVDLQVFTVFRGMGLAEPTLSSVISTLLNEFEYDLIVQKIGEEIPSQDPETVLNPISLYEKTIIKGTAVNIHPNIFFGLMAAQSTGMPVGVMMLLIFAMQLAATSVASEKEEKTLETLLTLPVNRFTILVGKLTGSIIVAVVGAVAYIIGFSYYMGSFSGIMPTESGVDLASIGLAPTPLSYLLLGVSLFMTLLSALALAISISVFAEDVRGAQALVGPLSILLVFPMIFTMFTDIHALPLPLMIVLFAIPFTHPMLAAKLTFTGDYLTAVLGIVYVSIFTVAVLYVAAKLFGTEKILTAKLKFRRFRLRKSKSQTPDR